MSKRNFFIYILILCVIDQGIKIIINTYFLETNFVIIPSLLEFKPFFNDKHSYPNSLLYTHFNVDVGIWLHGILFLLIIVFSTCFVAFVRNNNSGDKRYLEWAYIFLFSAAICSISGNFIWEKGVLDFIYLKPIFIFDLKDLYVNCFIILFAIYYYKNRNYLQTLSTTSIFNYSKKSLRKKILSNKK